MKKIKLIYSVAEQDAFHIASFDPDISKNRFTKSHKSYDEGGSF